MRVAVVGAGLAGLACARALHDGGAPVVVWEKSRGAGGRTATRRGPDGMRFDHGAPWLHEGPAALAGVPALTRHRTKLADGTTLDGCVGDGSMNAPAKALSDGLDLRTGVRVAALRRTVDGRSELVGDDGAVLDVADAVVVTAPAPQAAELLADVAPGLAGQAAGVVYDPCWTAMVAWPTALDLGWTAARDAHGLGWAVAEAPKPGRGAGERWVLQADAVLSETHLEEEPGAVVALLLERFAALAGRPLPPPSFATAHRWRFSRPRSPLGSVLLQGAGPHPVLAAGDWCGGDDAGAAVRSGGAAAAALLAAPASVS